MDIEASSLRPLKNSVFVRDLDHGVRQTRGGIILPDDNMKESGIRDRWAQVYAIGPEVDAVKVGDWVLIQHGRWTNRLEMTENGDRLDLWRIDYPEGILLVSDEDPRLRKITL